MSELDYEQREKSISFTLMCFYGMYTIFREEEVE